MRRGLDLRVITARRQAVSRLLGKRPCLAWMPQLVRKNAAHELFGGPIGALEHDHAKVAKQAIEQAGERVGHRVAGRVGILQVVEELGREFRLLQRCRELADGRGNLVAERDPADRDVSGAGGCGQRDRAPLQVGIEDRHRRDFVPIVIFRLDPEDGNRHDLVFPGNVCGEFCGGQRLVEREQRAAEQSRLLSRDNRDGTGIGESRSGIARGLWRVPAFELSRKNAAELGALPRMLLRGVDGPRP